jgi:hypothetical protein
MKKNTQNRIATFALTLSLASIGLVGCKKEEVVAPQQEVAQQSVTQEVNRQILDNKMLEDALKGGLEMAGSVSHEKGLSKELATYDTRAFDDWGGQPVDTEKKIYDANNPVGMRWKKSDGNFATRGNPTLNVTQLYRQEYQKIIAVLSTGAELRLTGNSLGGNLTMSMLREVSINGSRLPARVTLMDPYWDPSIGIDDGVTLPTGLADTKAVGVNAAQRLNNAGVAIEYFRTSYPGEVGYNRGVAFIAAYVNFRPTYTMDIAAQHTQPHKQYMWNMGFAMPATGFSPRTSNAIIRTLMSSQSFWNHTGGMDTATPEGDIYTLENGKP